MAPGLRFGFAVLPTRHMERVTRSLRTAAWGAPGLVTALATGWLSDGMVACLEEDRRKDAAARQDIARALLAGLDVTAHRASYSVWLGLEPHRRPDRVAAVLAEQGILVTTVDAFATGLYRPHAIRLALATVPRDELGGVLRHLRAQIETIPPWPPPWPWPDRALPSSDGPEAGPIRHLPARRDEAMH